MCTDTKYWLSLSNNVGTRELMERYGESIVHEYLTPDNKMFNKFKIFF